MTQSLGTIRTIRQFALAPKWLLMEAFMLLRILCAVLVSIFISPFISSATTITREPIEELFKRADYVALVRVDMGETIFAKCKLCGAKYKASVIDGIKGVRSYESLEWCTSAGWANDNLEIGTSYLVFLTKPGSRYDPIGSTNSFSEKRRTEVEESCRAILQGNRVIHSGNGALRVEIPMLGRSSSVLEWTDETIRIPSMAIKLPDVLKSQQVVEKGQEIFACQDVWVRLEDLVSYLKTLEP